MDADGFCKNKPTSYKLTRFVTSAVESSTVELPRAPAQGGVSVPVAFAETSIRTHAHSKVGFLTWCPRCGYFAVDFSFSLQVGVNQFNRGTVKKQGVR